jgi:hypothetical protein
MAADLLTAEQLAELLHTSPSAIHSQRHRGQAPGRFGVKLGRRIFFRRQDLDKYFTAELAKQTDSAP